MTKPDVKRYQVQGPNGAVAVVRVGGPRGMSERHWQQRTKSGELTVLEELDADGLPVKSKRGSK